MTSVEWEKGAFDLTHDTVSIYRILLNAMSKPGTVGNIRSLADKLQLPQSEDRVGLAIALTLLDGTTRFSVHMQAGKQFEDAVRRQTFCQLTDSVHAEYVFIDGDFNEADLHEIFMHIHGGTLLQPELGATVLARVDEVSAAAIDNAAWLATGPGIRSKAGFNVSGFSHAWFIERAHLNVEYPIGIDLILYDKYGNILAIPRTTKVEEGKEAWAM
jgi:alpha-D-ribose 1-methylphosphonate 5-triphosphate synthase subunit PhnH